MVSVLASSAVVSGFVSRSGQTKDYKIGICCFSAKQHAALRRKSKDWLDRNQDCVLVGRHIYPVPFYQLASTIKIQLSVLV